ncbi:MAG: tetratricopeptide repeat protein, partial [Ktedonobacteraceae bacterium]|nr:tetratricopeptide repeat protein [Ktedonobacteraceae bacterium]
AWTDALGYLGIAQAARGWCAEGKASGQRAVEHVRHSGEVKSYQELRARHFRSIICLYSNDLFHMLEESDWVVQEAEKIGDWLLVYWAYGLRSWAQSRLGEHEAALQSMTRVREVASRSGGHMICQDILEAANAELLLATGHVEEALTCAQGAITLAREEVGGLLSEGIAERVQGQALAHLARWEEAQIHLEASVQILRSGEALLEAARTHVAWGLLCRDHGEQESARTHFERASVQFEASGLIRECEALNEYLAHLCKG